ncbi:hypothetical protein [Undibacterium luofuense]|uniref:Uncharacterized protein n=1 Tax=Undibacterium luofuense TaxID=2828733 RepID=A0A941DRE0_9BURK|nr:hypothetical protein [Undibacterium luofuense]MBR7782671.1 hypothetical protein [Undibacterium luofuense]
MRSHPIVVNDEELALLEQVRLQQGLGSVDEAAEWLVKRRLRRQSKQITGRGRSLYVVERNPE